MDIKCTFCLSNHSILTHPLYFRKILPSFWEHLFLGQSLNGCLFWNCVESLDYPRWLFRLVTGVLGTENFVRLVLVSAISQLLTSLNNFLYTLTKLFMIYNSNSLQMLFLSFVISQGRQAGLRLKSVESYDKTSVIIVLEFVTNSDRATHI